MVSGIMIRITLDYVPVCFEDLLDRATEQVIEADG